MPGGTKTVTTIVVLIKWLVVALAVVAWLILVPAVEAGRAALAIGRRRSRVSSDPPAGRPARVRRRLVIAARPAATHR